MLSARAIGQQLRIKPSNSGAGRIIGAIFKGNSGSVLVGAIAAALDYGGPLAALRVSRPPVLNRAAGNVAEGMGGHFEIGGKGSGVSRGEGLVNTPADKIFDIIGIRTGPDISLPVA